MKYRTKLYIAFSSLVLACIILVEGLTFIEMRPRFLQTFRREVDGIGATAALTLNSQDIKAVIDSRDTNSAEFNGLVNEMQRVRAANERAKTLFSAIYIIAPDSQNQLIMVVDPTRTDPPGTPYDPGEKIDILEHKLAIYSPKVIENDRWGKFLPSYVPILDENGNYVATLAVHISAKTFEENIKRLRWIALSASAIALVAGLIVASFLSRQITHSLSRIYSGIKQIGSRKTKIEVSTDDEFGELARAINEMTKGLEERDYLKLNFAPYVSKHIMEKIAQVGKMPTLEGEKKKVTILFADLRAFSKFAEEFPPEKVVSQLNEFLTVMIDVIFENDGTLDKFLGDGMMVEFGAPLDDPNQETHAIVTAIAMQKALIKLNREFEKRGSPKMDMAIGIHTGTAILGNIGSEKRMEYTAVGDTVNTASRIEEEAKKLDAAILISEATWKAIQGQFVAKDHGPLQLRGKEKPLRVFSIEFSREMS